MPTSPSTRMQTIVGNPSRVWQFLQCADAQDGEVCAVLTARLRVAFATLRRGILRVACRAEARSEIAQARLRVAARRFGAASFACVRERRMVDQNIASRNQLAPDAFYS